MDVLENFPVRLRQCRKEYGYSMEKVAELLDVSVPAISAYERGTRMPTLYGLVEIAKIYHCTTDYLLGIEQESPGTSDVGIKLTVLKQRLAELEQLVNA